MLYHLASCLPLMVCLVWTVLLLAEFRSLDAPRRVLTVFGVVTTVLYACHFVFFERGSAGFFLTDCIWCFCTLSVYPLYCLYVTVLTTKDFPPLWQILCWLLPALGMSSWAVYILLTGTDSSLFRRIVGLVDLAVSLSAAAVCFSRLVPFRRRVRNYYADAEDKLLNPVLVVLILLVAASLATAVVSLIGREHFSGQDNLIIPALVFSSLLFGIFLVGFKTVFPSSEVREEDSSAELEDGHLSSLMERIDREMVVGELFRKKGLKISDLAEAVGSNRSYVSAAVNRFAGISFSDYVNRYRIRYAQELIRSDRTVQMTEVSDRSGFVDRVSFYRSFKRATGKSPSEWMADFYDLQH